MDTPEPSGDAPLPWFLTRVKRAVGAETQPVASAADPSASDADGAAEAVDRDLPPDHAVASPDLEAEPDRPQRVVGLPRPAILTGEAALTALPVTAVTRRRIGWLAGAAVTLWVLALFVRQVGDASAAQARADQISRENDALSAQVEALAAEKELVQQPAFVALEARSHGFGQSRERAFVLAPGAPTLPPDAPGSAGLRVGRMVDTRTPLDLWLEILFGPAR